jgi:hypothetical protein
MKAFSTYFTERAIVTHICKLRVKVAKGRNKKHLIHLLTESEKYNYHLKEQTLDDKNQFSEYEFELNNQLIKILPSRKNWVKLGSKSRMNRDGSDKLTSNDKNFYSLLKTIKVYRKKDPNVSWLIELDKFVKDIQSASENDSFKIDSPIIFPKLKKEVISKNERNECRPISMFSLKERIILSITNKFLTPLFDVYFQDCSYAFRSKKNKEETSIVSHHDCIKEIIDIQKRNNYKPLFVVECDIEKFYDSVNHTVVRDLFNNLIDRAREDTPELDFKIVEHIFNEYLNCYAFNKNVPLSSDIQYWESYSIPNGKFSWIEERLSDLNYYPDIDSERIGVPQGGALSGLIANIVLNEADKQVLKTDVSFIRFCDDMLIIHDNINECEKAKNIYLNSLEELKLVPHKFIDELRKKTKSKGSKKSLSTKNNWFPRIRISSLFSFLKKLRFFQFRSNKIVGKLKSEKKIRKYTFKPFWHTKSKGAYKWDSIENNGFPWIGFVGYEIHNEGNIRVRKNSLDKELKKQKKIVAEIEKAIELGQRKVKGYVIESAINRLIGMSVGRIGLNNFDEVSSDMCWKNGFKELKLNKDSTRQIKQLDRSRSKLYYNLLKTVKDLEKEPEDENVGSTEKQRQIIHYNKPYSYYYQVLERSKKQ